MKHNIAVREISESEWADILNHVKSKEEVLFRYADLLLWWNDRINLVSRDVSRETILDHIRHSVCISLAKTTQESISFLDAGSGGGLPGIPLAVIKENSKVSLNDIVSKKMFATNDIIGKLQLKKRVSVLMGSIEAQSLSQETCVVSKHAFKVNELHTMLKTKKWRAIVFLKGANEAAEELNKIEAPLKVEIIKLDAPFMSDFYKGKAVVQVERLYE